MDVKDALERYIKDLLSIINREIVLPEQEVDKEKENVFLNLKKDLEEFCGTMPGGNIKVSFESIVLDYLQQVIDEMEAKNKKSREEQSAYLLDSGDDGKKVAPGGLQAVSLLDFNVQNEQNSNNPGLAEELKKVSTKADLDITLQGARKKLVDILHEKEGIKIADDYNISIHLEKIEEDLRKRISSIIDNVGGYEFESYRKSIQAIIDSFSESVKKQKEYCFFVEKKISDVFRNESKRELKEIFADDRLEIINRFESGLLAKAHNEAADFEYYIIKRPKMDVTGRKVSEKGEYCSVAAFEIAYGLRENEIDENGNHATISVQTEEATYYMTREEYGKILEEYKQKAGQENSLKCGPGIAKEVKTKENEKRDAVSGIKALDLIG